MREIYHINPLPLARNNAHPFKRRGNFHCKLNIRHNSTNKRSLVYTQFMCPKVDTPFWGIFYLLWFIVYRY